LNLINNKNSLGGGLKQPAVTDSSVGRVGLESFLGDLVEGSEHSLLNVVHPRLHRSSGESRFSEIDNFSFRTDHRGNLSRILLSSKLDTLDGIEAFVQVRLHGLGVTCLRQNLNEFVISQEEETRESSTLSG
jgi:hypothetical protein